MLGWCPRLRLALLYSFKGFSCHIKALIGIRKQLCVILVVQTQTQERHRDSKPLYYKSQTFDNRQPSVNRTMEKKGNQIEKLPLYLEKLLKLSILKSSVGQSYNVLKKGASKRFILPTMLNSLMKVLALKYPHTSRKGIAISNRL